MSEDLSVKPGHDMANGSAPEVAPDSSASVQGHTDNLERSSSTVDVFRTCADPGRKRSLKSLEIPMENLLSGIIYLPGGRSKESHPTVVLTQPKSLQGETLRQLSQDDIQQMLIYFTTVPREEVRSRGFCVVMDGGVIQDYLQVIMVKALHQLQMDMGCIQVVYCVSPAEPPNWNTKCGEIVALPFQYVKNYDDLFEFIDKSQLVPELGGYLEYDHQDWVKFRIQVEPFLCDCVTISKRLAQVIEPFSQDAEPKSLEETEKCIRRHKLKRRKTIEQLHIKELTSEGLKINRLMRTESEERRSSIQANPDVLSTITTVQKLISNIEAVRERLEIMWSAKGEKLEATFKQQAFEKEANQIIEWFEEYAEEFFQTHSDLGESQQVAETLTKEIVDFESSTKQILVRTDKLLQSGTILETLKHTNHSTIQLLMGKIKQLMTDFDDRLGKRKKKIDESVQLQKLTEMSLDWCIESAGLLSEYDLLSQSQDFDPALVIIEIDKFLDNNPAPSAENQQALLELAETTENLWAKQNALFAYNRVMEISERFHYHQQILEGMVATRKQGKQGKVSSQLPPVEKDTNGRADRLEKVEEDAEMERVSMTDGESELEPDIEEPDGSRRSLRSLQKHEIETQKSLRVSSELLDLDEALSFLENVATNPEKIPATLAISTPLEKWKVSPAPSPEPHRLSKQDISSPTQTLGPLFSAPGSPDWDDMRRLSCHDMADADLLIQTKNAKYRRQLMQELIETEKAYIGHLEWVVEKYMSAMDNLDALPRNLVGKKNVIFSNLQQLLEINRQLILPQLEQCRKVPIKLGAIFGNCEEEFMNYSKYFKNMPSQSKLMEEGGIEFFAAVQYELKENYSLSSYLIKPFQRITKYKLFLEDMIKHSSKADHKGKLKEYFEQLKEAHKMVDFVLRHGNDLLAVESLKRFEGSLREQGKILRQGDLVVYEKHHKHKRRVFLFEGTIVLAKTKKPKHLPDIPGSEVFEFRSAYKTSDFTLYEHVPGYPTRFELRKKKESLIFHAETEDERTCWVQDVWDLYFSHMLSLKDQNLEAYGSRALTSVVSSGLATLTRGRPLGHSMRRSLRYSAGTPRTSRGELRPRPPSQISITSVGSTEDIPVTLRQRAGTYSPTTSTNRLSGTFVDLRPNRLSASSLDEYSDRSSMVSTSSTSTLTSLNLGETTQPASVSVSSPSGPSPQPSKRLSQLTREVHRAEVPSKEEATATSQEGTGTPEVLAAESNSPTGSNPTSEDGNEGEESIIIFDTPV